MSTKQDEAYARTIALHNSGQRVPAVRMVQENPKAAALISKLVADKRGSQAHNTVGNRDQSQINPAEMRAISMMTSQDGADAETVTQILSDTELAAQILVSSILSPKDMMTVDPTYTSAPGKWNVPNDINAALIKSAREHFEQVYKIKTMLPTMLHDILFRRGSYPIAVIPENAVDEIIHNKGAISVESIKEFVRDDGTMHPIGILGPRDEDHTRKAGAYKLGVGLSLEHILNHTADKGWDGKVKMPQLATEKLTVQGADDPNVWVTDNLSLLKMPKVAEHIRSRQVSNVINKRGALSVENVYARLNGGTQIKASDRQLASTFYSQSQVRYTQTASVKSQSRLARRSVGGPLVMHLPSEAVIPVHIPNQPNRHIGFFVLIDQEGNPLCRTEGADHYRELSQRFSTNSSFSTAMLERSKSALNDNNAAMNNGWNRNNFNTASRLYSQMLEDDLMQRLRNGMIGSNATIATDEEISRLMLARTLANQQTQLLYIPAEYVTYMAFQYKSNGIGKSLLDNSKIINSMRAMLLVGNVMASLRNSIGRTRVNLKLDPASPDPMKSLELAMGEITRVNMHGFPLGSTNPLEITESLQRSMFEFGITGHPGLPDMEIDFQQKNDSYAKPDPDLEESLRKRALAAYYLTPEMLDAANGADFATSVANNSTLFSKRALTLQQQFTPMVSDHARKYMANRSDLLDEYISIVEENYDAIVENLDDEIVMSDGSLAAKKDLKENALLRSVVIKEIVEDFLANFTVSLPEPDVTKTDIQADAYEKHEKLVDMALNAWINEDMLGEDIVGEASGHIRTIKDTIKGYFMRDWQQRNGILPELAKLTSKGDDGEIELDLVQLQSAHANDIMSIVSGLFKLVKKSKEKVSKELQKAGLGDAGSDNTSGDTGNTDAGSGGSDMGFGGSGDDLGMGDMGGSGDLGTGGSEPSAGAGVDDFDFDASMPRMAMPNVDEGADLSALTEDAEAAPEESAKLAENAEETNAASTDEEEQPTEEEEPKEAPKDNGQPKSDDEDEAKKEKENEEKKEDKSGGNGQPS